MLELWQTEWCPASRRVRQRLTELGLDVILRQVPVEQADRGALLAATGATTIPVLVGEGDTLVGEQAILDYLGSRFPEPDDAASQRAKAARARARDLEESCRQLTVSTR
jgi:glutathione S-transferase